MATHNEDTATERNQLIAMAFSKDSHVVENKTTDYSRYWLALRCISTSNADRSTKIPYQDAVLQ